MITIKFSPGQKVWASLLNKVREWPVHEVTVSKDENGIHVMYAFMLSDHKYEHREEKNVAATKAELLAQL